MQGRRIVCIVKGGTPPLQTLSIHHTVDPIEPFQKIERKNELWFVDYCNNYKTRLAFKNDVPYHHPYTAGMNEKQLLYKQRLLE